MSCAVERSVVSHREVHPCAERKLQMTNVAKLPAAEGPTFLDYVAHPLANMFPMIEGRESENLKESIAKSGILEPITLFQGMILDGRNRYAAAKAVGHPFTPKDFREWHGSTLVEAEEWVISTNLHRRHLTAKQKQEMVRERIKKSPGMSNRQIAKLLGVSHTMVADERDRTLNPPEVKKFQEFKSTWEGLSDEHRQAFVREFNVDICDLQKSVVEHCSIADRKVGAAG
jgi:predicted transcriptional regulator